VQIIKQWLAFGPFVVLLLVLIACGSSSPSEPEGYLYQWTSSTGKGVAFIQIAHNGSSVSGTSETVEYQWINTTSATVWSGPTISRYAVKDDDDRNKVSLTLTPDHGTGGASISRSGRWHGVNLILDVPRSNGSLETAEFIPASVKSFNAAVRKLEIGG
jgi:hypothetical protein